MPDTLTIAARVRAIIAEQLNRDAELVTDDAHLADDLDADSLDFVELAVGLEDKFNIAIDDDQVDRWSTVGDVVRTVEAQRNG